MGLDATTTTLLSVPTIIALTTLAKHLGVKGQWALLVATVLGAVLGATQHYLGDEPGFQAVAHGLLLGLAAAGLFDVAKIARAVPTPVPDTVEAAEAATGVAAGDVRADEPALPALPEVWQDVDIAALIASAEDEALADAAGVTSDVLASETGAGHTPRHAHEAATQ